MVGGLEEHYYRLPLEIYASPRFLDSSVQLDTVEMILADAGHLVRSDHPFTKRSGDMVNPI